MRFKIKKYALSFPSPLGILHPSGYYGELLVLEATNMVLGTCRVGGTFDRGNSFVEVKPDEELVCVIPFGNIAQEKTFKEKLIHKISHRKSKPLEELYISDSPVPQWFINGMKAVQKAPLAFNMQPVKFEYKNGDLSALVEDHRFLTELGIAKFHFSLAALLSLGTMENIKKIQPLFLIDQLVATAAFLETSFFVLP